VTVHHGKQRVLKLQKALFLGVNAAVYDQLIDNAHPSVADLIAFRSCIQQHSVSDIGVRIPQNGRFSKLLRLLLFSLLLCRLVISFGLALQKRDHQEQNVAGE